MTTPGLPAESDPRSPLNLSTASIVGMAMFAVGGFWALTVFGLGMMSLLVDRDVITDPRAGIGLGLAMVAAATLVLVAGLLRVALRRAPSIHWISLVGIVVSVYLAYLLAGLLAWLMFSTGPPGEAIFFIFGLAGDWPSLIMAINALIIALSYFGTLSYRMRHPNPFDPSPTPG